MKQVKEEFKMMKDNPAKEEEEEEPITNNKLEEEPIIYNNLEEEPIILAEHPIKERPVVEEAEELVEVQQPVAIVEE